MRIDQNDELAQFENTRHPYGKCPHCGAMCQPDYYDKRDLTEFVVCCDCQIEWILHHENDQSIRSHQHPADGYRISGVGSFADDIVKPDECKEG